jgi:hypothetical protein
MRADTKQSLLVNAIGPARSPSPTAVKDARS